MGGGGGGGPQHGNVRSHAQSGSVHGEGSVVRGQPVDGLLRIFPTHCCMSTGTYIRIRTHGCLVHTNIAQSDKVLPSTACSFLPSKGVGSGNMAKQTIWGRGAGKRLRQFGGGLS
jgi:hypothetical protein